MDEIEIDHETLIQNLKDAGMNEDKIQAFLISYQANQENCWMNILNRHRCCLAADIRKGQEKLFCLDYLIRRLKQHS